MIAYKLHHLSVYKHALNSDRCPTHAIEARNHVRAMQVFFILGLYAISAWNAAATVNLSKVIQRRSWPGGPGVRTPPP